MHSKSICRSDCIEIKSKEMKCIQSSDSAKVCSEEIRWRSLFRPYLEYFWLFISLRIDADENNGNKKKEGDCRDLVEIHYMNCLLRIDPRCIRSHLSATMLPKCVQLEPSFKVDSKGSHLNRSLNATRWCSNLSFSCKIYPKFLDLDVSGEAKCVSAMSAG